MKEGEERKQALVNVLELWIYQSIMSASSDKTETDTHTFSYIHSIFRRNMNYTKSLVNTNSFYTNFTNTDFQKVPIPHLTRTMKQKFLHYLTCISFHVVLTNFVNMTFSMNQK